MRALLLFVDGVGLGPDDPDTNPLAATSLPALELLAGETRLVLSSDISGGSPLRALDATLGVPGLPQSGTGQTALITGVNAAAHLGRHRGPYPGVELMPLLARHNLLRHLKARGRSLALANAYPDFYLARVRRGTGRMSVVARAAHMAGARLRGPRDLQFGRAVSSDLTGRLWRTRLGYCEAPRLSEEEAGGVLARVARRHDFSVFIYYATDIAGHHADFAEGVRALEALDRLTAGLVREWSSLDVLVVASDHGNVEDMTTRRHTRNPALGIWVGPQPRRLPEKLTDVAPALLDLLVG